MKTLKILGFIILFLIVSFFTLRIIWGFQPKHSIKVLILDKTVKDYKWTEHRSFSWILKHNRYCKENNNFYSYKKDYYGFIPSKPKKNRNYEIKRIKIMEVGDLTKDYDMLYLADARGVYFNEWYQDLHSNNQSLLYGGLNQNDYLLLKGFVEANKPVICEYDIFSPPTTALYRRKSEEVLNIRWTGWKGKYYKSLKDAGKATVPAWVVKEYKSRNEGKWPFQNAGIILTKGRHDFIVLEENTHLQPSILFIKTTEDFANTYALPTEVEFRNEFEIVNPGNITTTLAYFSLPVTDEGQRLLEARRLPNEFPAILLNNDKPVFYFTGDFAESTVKMYTAGMAGVKNISKIMAGREKEFFWEYYEPLMTGILESFNKALAED